MSGAALATRVPRPLHHPTILIGGRETRVIVEQTTVVDPQRLGRSAGRLDPRDLQAIDEALALILGL